MLFLGEMHIIVCWTGSPNIPLLVPHCHRSLVWLPTKHVPCCPSVPSQLSWSSITSPLHTGFERAQQQCLLLIYQCTEEQHYSTFVRFHRLVRLWLQRQFFFLVFPSFSSRFNFSCCLFLPGGLKPAPKHTPHKRDHDRERRQICHPALLPSCSSHLNPAFPRIPWSLPAGTRAEKAESPLSPTASSNTLCNSNTIWSFQSSSIGWVESYWKCLFGKTTPKLQSFSLCHTELLVISTHFAKHFQLKTELRSTAKSCYQPFLCTKDIDPGWEREIQVLPLTKRIQMLSSFQIQVLLIQFTDAALVSPTEGVPLHVMYSNTRWSQKHCTSSPYCEARWFSCSLAQLQHKHFCRKRKVSI